MTPCRQRWRGHPTCQTANYLTVETFHLHVIWLDELLCKNPHQNQRPMFATAAAQPVDPNRIRSQLPPVHLLVLLLALAGSLGTGFEIEMSHRTLWKKLGFCWSFAVDWPQLWGRCLKLNSENLFMIFVELMKTNCRSIPTAHNATPRTTNDDWGRCTWRTRWRQQRIGHQHQAPQHSPKIVASNQPARNCAGKWSDSSSPRSNALLRLVVGLLEWGKGSSPNEPSDEPPSQTTREVVQNKNCITFRRSLYIKTHQRGSLAAV